MSQAPITAPERLADQHDLSQFESGEPALDDWLRRRARQNDANGASRTYVVCSGGCVVGYYSLAVGAVGHADSPGNIKRNMPDPIPVMVLARLAVDRKYQGRSIGSGLLRDAVLRTLQAAEIAGIRAILVHAISETAKDFYEARGFRPSPISPMTLVLSLREAEAIFDSAPRP